jgi:hypothetical protein
MLKKTLVLLAIIISNSCFASNLNINYGSLRYYYENIRYTASFTQWNEEYAVTAKHVEHLEGSVYICDYGCDLQFFKHKNTQQLPSWRNALANEKLIFVGQNGEQQKMVSVGINMDNSVKDTQTGIYMGKLARVTVIPGMSGGPVYGMDGRLVGMSFASVKKSLDNYGPNAYSLYIPYEVIQKQWNIYLSQYNGNSKSINN